MLWLNEAACTIFGIPNPESVPAAPPPQSLRVFGGPLTRKDFRSRIASGRAVACLEKPMLTFPMKILDETESIRDAAQELSCISLFETHTQSIKASDAPAPSPAPDPPTPDPPAPPKPPATPEAAPAPEPAPAPPPKKTKIKKNINKKKKKTTKIKKSPKKNTLFNYVLRKKNKR